MENCVNKLEIKYLLIGNKNYSSWSLRAWLCLQKTGVIFEEIKHQLYVDGYQLKIMEHSPTGLVPVYCHGDVRIWDSLAICEYLAEANPDLWPSDSVQRARARAISAEMHSGFRAIRGQIPMNCRAIQRQVEFTPELQKELQRVEDIWTQCRQDVNRQDGAWLFGRFSIADAMYIPLVLHFKTYGVVMNEICEAYMRMALADVDVQKWVMAALEEQDMIAECEVG